MPTCGSAQSCFWFSQGVSVGCKKPDGNGTRLPNLDHCGGSGGCNGGTQELVYSYAMLRGLAMNATFPYYGENRSCQISEPMQRGDSYKTTKAVAGITGYMKLKPNDDIELLNTVANRGPVSVSVDASKW